MKKLIILTIAALFMFTGVSFAENCVDCDGKSNPCDDAFWPCPDDQDKYCEYVGDWRETDFDGDGEKEQMYGFCPAIFKVCDCEDVDDFKGGTEVAVRWSSLTEGAYFIDGWNYGGWGNTGEYGSNVVSGDMALDYLMGYWSGRDQDNTPECTNIDQIIWFNNQILEGDIDEDSSTWKNGGFYQWDDLLLTDVDGDTCLQSGAGGTGDCFLGIDSYKCTDIKDSNKIVQVETVDSRDSTSCNMAGYTITKAENETVWWGVNMPFMIVDWSEITRDVWAQVKVELVNATSGTGLCVDCKVICECIVDVFRVCQGAESTDNELYFPYVLYGIYDSSGWFTGIAVSNIRTVVDPGNMEISFTFIDNDGVKFTGKMTGVTVQVFADSIEGIASTLGWTGVAPGAGVLLVETNFLSDGYQFNMSSASNGIFGAGVLPRLGDVTDRGNPLNARDY